MTSESLMLGKLQLSGLTLNSKNNVKNSIDNSHRQVNSSSVNELLVTKKTRILKVLKLTNLHLKVPSTSDSTAADKYWDQINPT